MNFAEVETSNNLMAPDQTKMVNAVVYLIQALTASSESPNLCEVWRCHNEHDTFSVHQFWPLLLDGIIKFVQLEVHSQINHLVV